jgi:hypothetical protein
MTAFQSKQLGADANGRTVYEAAVSLTCYECGAVIAVGDPFARTQHAGRGYTTDPVCCACAGIQGPITKQRKSKAGYKMLVCAGCGKRMKPDRANYPQEPFKAMRRTGDGWEVGDTVCQPGAALCWQCGAIPPIYKTWQEWIDAGHPRVKTQKKEL